MASGKVIICISLICSLLCHAISGVAPTTPDNDEETGKYSNRQKNIFPGRIFRSSENNTPTPNPEKTTPWYKTSEGLIYAGFGIPIAFCFLFCITSHLVAESQAATPYYTEAKIWLGLFAVGALAVVLFDTPKSISGSEFMLFMGTVAAFAGMPALQGWLNEHYILPRNKNQSDLFFINMFLDIALTAIVVVPILIYTDFFGPKKQKPETTSSTTFRLIPKNDRTDIAIIWLF